VFVAASPPVIVESGRERGKWLLLDAWCTVLAFRALI